MTVAQEYLQGVGCQVGKIVNGEFFQRGNHGFGFFVCGNCVSISFIFIPSGQNVAEHGNDQINRSVEEGEEEQARVYRRMFHLEGQKQAFVVYEEREDKEDQSDGHH